MIIFLFSKSYSQPKSDLLSAKEIIINVKTDVKNSSGTALLVFYNCYFKDYDASDFILDREITPTNPGFPNKTRKIQAKSFSDILNVMNIHMAQLNYALKEFHDWRTDGHHLEFVNIVYEKQ